MKLFGQFAWLTATFCAACLARGQVVYSPADQMLINSPFPGDASAGSDPITAVVSNSSHGGSIELTIEASGLTGTEFTSDAYFNFNPNLNMSDLSVVIGSGSTNGVQASSIQFGEDQFKSDGDGFYDMHVNFGTQGNGTPLTNGQEVNILISSSQRALTASDMDFLSTEGGGEGIYYAATHVQGLTGGTSTWTGATAFSAIPEPETSAMWLGAIAASGAVLYWRRRPSAVLG